MNGDAVIYAFYADISWFDPQNLQTSYYEIDTVEELMGLSFLVQSGYTFSGTAIYAADKECVNSGPAGKNVFLSAISSFLSFVGISDDSVVSSENVTIDLGGIDWLSVGSAEHPFQGTFDGGSYDDDGNVTAVTEISGLSVTGTKTYAGLFGYIKEGTIANITLVSGTVNAIAEYMGALAGQMSGEMENISNACTVVCTAVAESSWSGGIVGKFSGTANNLSNSATVSGGAYTGGIAGSADGFMGDATNKGTISGSTYTGGIAGFLTGTGRALANQARITGSGYIGGVAGYYDKGTASGDETPILEYGSNTQRITASGASSVAGGIAGAVGKGATVRYCSNRGSIVASNSSAAGGIAGQLVGARLTAGYVIGSFNRADVTCTYSRGSVVGSIPANASDHVVNCVNMTASAADAGDADCVTYTGDVNEAAYTLDNGEDERYGVWGVLSSLKYPSMVKDGAAAVYRATVISSGENIVSLSAEYLPVNDTLQIVPSSLDVNERLIVYITYANGETECLTSEDAGGISLTMPGGDLKVVAGVVDSTRSGYTVTFHAENGGTEPFSVSATEAGNPVNEPKDIPTYFVDDAFGSYVFCGWYEKKGGELAEEPYNFEKIVTDDMDLYAKWSAVTIVYDLNGVVCSEDAPESVTTGNGSILSWPDITPVAANTYYEFAGWSTEKVSKLGLENLWKFDSDSDPTVVQADADNTVITLYAVWEYLDAVNQWARTYSVSGSGTEEDPFLIATDLQLNRLAVVFNNNNTLEGYYFRLDPNAGGESQAQDSYTLSTSFTGMRFQEYVYDGGDYYYMHTKMQGHFDGSGCTIDISENASAGVFGTIGDDGEVRNLQVTGNVISGVYGTYTDEFNGGVGVVANTNYGAVEDCTVKGISMVKAYNEGVVVGYNLGTISGCSAEDCEIEGGESISGVGGIAGTSYGSIENCEVNRCSLTGGMNVGGIVGYISGTSSNWINLRDCKTDDATAVTSKNYYAGGIAGYAQYVNISRCVNSAAVTAEGNSHMNGDSEDANVASYIGGIAGLLRGDIENCDNYGKITANGGYSAGVIGWYITADNDNQISDCANYGDIVSATTGNNCIYSVGGVIGCFHVSGVGGSLLLQDCANHGDILVETEAVRMIGVGGLIGSLYGAYTTLEATSDITLQDCTEDGSISVVGGKGTVKYVAGLIGHDSLSNSDGHIYAEGCSLSADIDVDVSGSSYAERVGGIFSLFEGEVDSETLSGINVEEISIKIIGNAHYVGGYLSGAGDESLYGLECGDMVSVEITGDGQYIGGVTAEGDVEHCSFDGSLKVYGKSQNVGGLTGDGDVKESRYIGTMDFSPGLRTGLLTGTGDVSSSYSYTAPAASGGDDTGLTGAGTIAASYYLTEDSGSDGEESSESEADETYGRTKAQFLSGEVAWLMETQGGNSQESHLGVWYQKDGLPVWSNGLTIYRVRTSPVDTELGTLSLSTSDPGYLEEGESVTATVTVNAGSVKEDGVTYVYGAEISAYADTGLSDETQEGSEEAKGERIASSAEGETVLIFSLEKDTVVSAAFSLKPEEEEEQDDLKEEDDKGQGGGKGSSSGRGTGKGEAPGNNSKGEDGKDPNGGGNDAESQEGGQPHMQIPANSSESLNDAAIVMVPSVTETSSQAAEETAASNPAPPESGGGGQTTEDIIEEAVENEDVKLFEVIKDTVQYSLPAIIALVLVFLILFIGGGLRRYRKNRKMR